MEFRRNRYGGLFPITGAKKPIQSTSDVKSKIKTGATGSSKKEVINKAKELLGKDAKVFNSFQNKSKQTDNNASKCKQVARQHKNPHTGYIVTKQTINNKTTFSTIAHDFNVQGKTALDYVNHKSVKSNFKNLKVVAYVGKPLNNKYTKNNKKGK